MAEKARILVVEDELLVADDLREILTGSGYEVVGIVNSGTGAIRLAGEHHPNLVLMDINLNGEMDGITAASEIRSRWSIPVIYATAYATRSIVDRAKKTDPFGFIFKPYNEMQIEMAIEIALNFARIEQQLREHKESLRLRKDTPSGPVSPAS
ncbi:MAG: response regulator [Methanoregula sp.]